VCSLGAVLAFAATGTPPFPGDSSAALLYKVVHEEPRLDALDGDLRGLVAACLAKDPAARPAPGEVARRLAPEGAARLVSGGWLPGALVERVSRSAVQLLNLEAADASNPTPVSGPVGFSSPSVGAPDANGGAAGPGVFGPAPVMPTPTAANVPGPRDGDRPPSPAPGKLSVSVAATSTREGEGRRGRRISCTVALAVAGAMAAVTVGSVFVLDLLPGGGRDDNADDGGRNPSATAPSEPGSDGGGRPVPGRYLGTWEGQAVAVEGNLPLGTFRLTVREAAVGARLGTMRHTDLFGGTCDDVLTLRKVTGKQVVASAVGAEGNRDVCNQARHTVVLTPVGDDLEYASDSEDSGRPKARLSKVG
ncbi:serine/threonine protein kinase, partial [Streptomyces sp. NPDC057074]